MKPIFGDVRVHFRYEVHFTTDLFAPENPTFREGVTGQVCGEVERSGPARVLFVVEQAVEQSRSVCVAIAAYFQAHGDALALAGTPLLWPEANRSRTILPRWK